MQVLSVLKRVSETGLSFVDSPSDKRNLILTNRISMIVTAVPALLSVAILTVAPTHSSTIFRLLGSTFLFGLPLVVNRFGFTNASRIALCWLPPVLIFGLSILDVHYGSPMSASSYVGLRLFLITAGCFPYLIFNLRDGVKLLLGISATLFSLVFFDAIFDLFNAAYWVHNPLDPLYKFNDVRALIAFVAVGLSCFFLKRHVEQNESINEKLVLELAEKNKVIRQQAEDDVHALNQQLRLHVHQLQEREFSLNQSQKIAKIGSWEYLIKDAYLFCSDEVYNIFGLDQTYDFRTEDLAEILEKNDSEILTSSTDTLLKTGKSFDITLRAKTPFGYSKWIRVNAFAVMDGEKILGARGICHDITYYREADELLRTSENKYRSLFEQASDFIMITDFKGQFIDVNESMCAAFGYSKEELRQMNISFLMDPAELDLKPIRFDALMGGEHILDERRMIRKSGSIIVVEANVRKLQDSMVLVIARDITTFRNAQRQIALNEALFRSAFESSAIGMALISPNGKWLRVNKKLCDIAGYAESELLGTAVRDITHPEDNRRYAELTRQLLQGELESCQHEKRYIHKNGSIVWINMNTSLVKDQNNQPLYLVAQIEDITVEKEAREKLALSQANLAATINNTNVFIWSVDRSFKLLIYNDAFFNYIRKEYGFEIRIGSKVFGEDSSENEEIYDRWRPRFERVLSGVSFIMEESRFGIDFQYSLSPILEAGRIIGISVIADNVTERKERDRQLLEANKKIGELKLMALRAVMNPHFIFNVLNSIQYYITKSDRYNAINYLSMFSRLIRTILTQSVDNKIKLSDEIEMLGNYIRLEMTRFENKFNFLLVVDPKVEADSIQIPSLLIQPYVENALLHGLYNKKDKGTLSIRIRQTEETIIFEIEDDGIGRAAAMQLRQQNFPTHKSMGIHVTEERLKLINQENHAAFKIDDLMTNGEPSGTRVTIQITI